MRKLEYKLISRAIHENTWLIAKVLCFQFMRGNIAVQCVIVCKRAVSQKYTRGLMFNTQNKSSATTNLHGLAQEFWFS